MRWYVRAPLKWAAFAAVAFFVSFPYPGQFARHIARIRNLQSLIDPDVPQLADLEGELRKRLERASAEATTRPSSPHRPTASPTSSAAVQRQVERLVLDKILYAWDWDTWGSADYIPTVEEMFTIGPRTADDKLFEDCDGRAVMAASLMKRLGYDATLVTDLRHVWVVTPEGEWMGPGGEKTVVSTPEGNRLNLATAVVNVPKSLSFGIAVFPLQRELLILVAGYLLMLHRRMSRRAAAVGGVLLLQGLLFMRCGIEVLPGPPGFAQSWPAYLGLLHVCAGVATLVAASRRARRSDWLLRASCVGAEAETCPGRAEGMAGQRQPAACGDSPAG